MKHKFLIKANDDVLSFCDCGNGYAAFPGQLGCPWCGCGWLFSCAECRRAYTFAKVVLVTEPWEDLARADLKARTDEEPGDDAIREWIEFMQGALEPLELGQICVYLDGSVIPVDKKNVAFDGWFATHDLSELPHAAAMAEPALLDRMLGDVSYWEERELPDGD